MNSNQSKNYSGLSGFTLMEVMIALLILAFSFTALLLVQSRATKLALDAKNISVATSLARLKLYECQMEIERNIAAASDIHTEGDFKEQGFPDIKWECHAPKFHAKPPSAEQVAEAADKKAPKGKDGAKAETDTSLISPLIGMVTESIGDAVRELAVIIRYGDNEEFRVVTHVVDVNAMAGLARMLSQGSSKKNEEPKKKQPNGAQEGMPLPGQGQGPGGRPPMYPPPQPGLQGMQPPMFPSGGLGP